MFNSSMDRVSSKIQNVEIVKEIVGATEREIPMSPRR